MTDERMFEVAAAAKRLKKCPETIRRYIRAGVLSGERAPGGAKNRPWLISESALYAFMRPVRTVQYGEEGYVDRCGIYFIEGAGLIKIGMASNVLDRFSGISVSSPVPVRMIGWIRTRHENLEATEAEAHAHFKDKWERGEWFRITEAEAVSYIVANDGEIGQPVRKNSRNDSQPAT